MEKDKQSDNMLIEDVPEGAEVLEVFKDRCFEVFFDVVRGLKGFFH
jgi:hypothetical protein